MYGVTLGQRAPVQVRRCRPQPAKIGDTAAGAPAALICHKEACSALRCSCLAACSSFLSDVSPHRATYTCTCCYLQESLEACSRGKRPQLRQRRWLLWLRLCCSLQVLSAAVFTLASLGSPMGPLPSHALARAALPGRVPLGASGNSLPIVPLQQLDRPPAVHLAPCA